MGTKEFLRTISSCAVALALSMQLLPITTLAESALTTPVEDQIELEAVGVADEREDASTLNVEEHGESDAEAGQLDGDVVEVPGEGESAPSEDDQAQPVEQPSTGELVAQSINKDISDYQEWEIDASTTSFYADGSPHSPKGVSFTSFQDDAWIELVEGQDFELDYCLDSNGKRTSGEPVNAGDYEAFYKGINGYSGTQSISFSIVAERSLDEAFLSIGKTVFLSTGSQVLITPRVMDTVTGELLVEGRDYSLEYCDASGHKLTGAPVQAGKYTVQAEGMGDYTGRSDSTAFEVMSADGAQSLSLGKSYSGSFTSSKQRAVFTFTLPSSGIIRFSGQAPKNTELFIFGPDGVLAFQRQSYEDGAVDFSSLSAFGPLGGLPLNAGSYTCVIGLGSGYGSHEAPLGDYALSMSFSSVEESFPESVGGTDNEFGSANAAQFGKRYKGLIALRDVVDLYAFDAQADGTASIELNAYKPWAVAHLYLTVYDEDGNEEWSGFNRSDIQYQESGTSSNTASWSFTGIELKAGTHYLKVSNGQDNDAMMAGYHGQYEFEVDFRSSGTVFIDISSLTPHAVDVTWLADSGISTGWNEKDGTRTFRPTNTVIRQDMAAFLFRLAKSWGLVDDGWQPTGSVTFTDVNPSTPHYREIMWLAESGISAGWKVGTGREFRPRNTVVRQDMAAFLRRLQALRDPSVRDWKPSGASPFRDVTARTPHSEDILWLAESGVSAGWKVGNAKEFRPTNTVIRQDMAAFLHRLDGLG